MLLKTINTYVGVLLKTQQQIENLNFQITLLQIILFWAYFFKSYKISREILGWELQLYIPLKNESYCCERSFKYYLSLVAKPRDVRKTPNDM